MLKWLCMYGFLEDVQFMIIEAESSEEAAKRFCAKSGLEYKERVVSRVLVKLLDHLHVDNMYYYDLEF